MHAPLSALVAVALLFSAPANAQVFEDVTVGSGLETVHQGAGQFSDGFGAGDWDGDGDLDLVVPGFSGQPIRYFRNEGSMRFVELDNETTGLGLSGSSHAITAVDIDNDGDLDMYIGNDQNPVQLYINEGNGFFVDRAADYGLTHISSNWGVTFGDYDLDGWLDLYVGNRDQPPFGGFLPEENILYRNTGQGSFVDVTAAAGVGSTRATFVTMFMDYNEDLLPDIIVPAEKGDVFGPNQIFENQGDGTFVDVAGSLNADLQIDAMGVDFIDLYNDGGLDYYVSDRPIDHLLSIWHPDLGIYVDETYASGVEGGPIGWAVQFADFDNDCWPDIHIVHGHAPNTIFRNPGRGSGPLTWTRVDYGLTNPGQTVALVADFDNDGRPDVLDRVRGPHMLEGGLVLHRNVTPSTGNWLQIDCVGTRSNRDGYGTRIELITAQADGSLQTQRQYVRSGAGFQTTNPKTLHFGLGPANEALLHVRWPSGQTHRVGPVAANQRIELVEPSLRARDIPRRGGLCRLRMDCPGDPASHYLILLSASDQPHTPIGGGRELPIHFDAVTAATLVPGNGVLYGNAAALHRDAGEAALVIPDDAGIVGLTFYATGLTYVPGGNIETVLKYATPIQIQP